MAKMKAISIKNPFAQLIAHGIKTLEIRSRKTTHRGDILICACGGKELWHNVNPKPMAFTDEEQAELYKSCGNALTVVTITDCRLMTPEDAEAAWCEYKEGHYAYVLSDPRPVVKQFPVLGQLGIYNVEVKEEFIGALIKKANPKWCKTVSECTHHICKREPELNCANDNRR